MKRYSVPRVRCGPNLLTTKNTKVTKDSHRFIPVFDWLIGSCCGWIQRVKEHKAPRFRKQRDLLVFFVPWW